MKPPSSLCALLGAIALGAVSRPSVAQVAPAPGFVSPRPETPVQRLHALRLDDSNWARAVLYSWTTPEQIAQLARTRVLLSSTASSPGPRSPFNRLLDHLARRRDDAGTLARLLLSDPVLEHRRYAWHVPYATVLGAGPRTYGTELVRIELREEAWVARLDPSREPAFDVTDLAGRPVPPAAWRASPRRIAAVYHLRAGPRERVHFREYIVCSEAMVRRWSVGTAQIADELRAERELLGALAPLTRPVYTRGGEAAVRAWGDASVTAASPAALVWRQALAFDNDRYRFREQNIRAATRALEAYTVADTLDVVPAP